MALRQIGANLTTPRGALAKRPTTHATLSQPSIVAAHAELRTAIHEAEAAGGAADHKLQTLHRQLQSISNRLDAARHEKLASSERARLLRDEIGQLKHQLARNHAAIEARDRRIELSRESLRESSAKLESLRVRHQIGQSRLHARVMHLGTLHERALVRAQQHAGLSRQRTRERLATGVPRWLDAADGLPSQHFDECWARWRDAAARRGRCKAVARAAVERMRHSELALAMRAWRLNSEIRRARRPALLDGPLG